MSDYLDRRGLCPVAGLSIAESARASAMSASSVISKEPVKVKVTDPATLRDPVFSAVLAFLVPGLGHIHQRRVFKGVLYAVCILGTFFTGLRIGHGQVVYFAWHPSENRTYAYLCQFWVGLPAIPALAQAQLRSPISFAPNYVPERSEADFQGTLKEEDGSVGALAGTIELIPQQPDDPRHWSGRITGTLTRKSGAVQIEGKLIPGGLDPLVAASPQRHVHGTLEGNLAGQPQNEFRGALEGSIPRPLWDYYGAPLQDSRGNEMAGDESELDLAHRELGSWFELGVVYTMIAGLLNILAIYDALEGPAYEDEEETEKTQDKPAPPPA